MSHFAVAVFTTDKKQSIKKLLAPYKYCEWDDYRIGGRYKDTLITKTTNTLKEPKNCDAAFVSDIDFKAMRQRDIAKLRPYGKALNDIIYGRRYMRERYPTKEEYIKRETAFGTYAVITPDGEWHCPDDMDTYSIHEDEREWDLTYYEQFIKPALENGWYMTIVDCHN